MSRAYRISVHETSTQELKGSDEICTRLEVLEILPPEQMRELLKKELIGKGFTEGEDGNLTRQHGNTTVTVDPRTCEVTVKASVAEEVSLEASRDAQGYDDVGPKQEELRERTRVQLQEEIAKKAGRESERLQGEATRELEEKLCELQPELSGVVNKVTREALKEKARQLGSVKEVTEDEETGSLTIKVEV